MFSEACAYHWRVLQMAFRLRRPFVFAQAVLAVVTVVGYAVIHLVVPVEAGTRAERVLIALVWQLPLGVFAGLILLRLLLAPYLVYREVAAERDTLKKQAGSEQATQDVRLGLDGFIEEGNDLRHDLFSAPRDAEQRYKALLESWTGRTRDFLQEHAPEYRGRFMVDRPTAMSYSGIAAWATDFVNYMDARLSALSEIQGLLAR